MGPTDASDSRLAALTRWLNEDLGFIDGRIEPASADASFRRYFRVTRDGDSCIVMDAPPDKEDCEPFVRVARSLAGIGLNVPLVLARELHQGFLLLSDLGTRQYLDELNAGRQVDRLYAEALHALVIMQTDRRGADLELPAYDRSMLVREMELLPEWFFDRHLQLHLSGAERDMLDRSFEALVQSALQQPRALVHRDYHSRNLLLTARNNPGILDFQDAVRGPITYDAVSLLKDCYIAWPAPRVRAWALEFRDALDAAGVDAGADASQFMRWFDLMGLQRHVKVLGIFARLFYRDGKSGYLKDLPRVLDYARVAAANHSETQELADFLQQRVVPAFVEAQARTRIE
ncbi:MAG: N-acetylmuramate/N-acetylglucosamine kinase [Steroidobacteraceae bacterium]